MKRDQQAWEAEAVKLYPMPKGWIHEFNRTHDRELIYAKREGYIAALSTPSISENVVADYQKILERATAFLADFNLVNGHYDDYTEEETLSRMANFAIRLKFEYMSNDLGVNGVGNDLKINSTPSISQEEGEKEVKKSNPPYFSQCEYPECECQQIITHRCKHRKGAAGEHNRQIKRLKEQIEHMEEVITSIVPSEFEFNRKDHHQSIYEYFKAYVAWSRTKISELEGDQKWISVSAETLPEEKMNQKYSAWVWCWDSFGNKAVIGTYCLVDKNWYDVMDMPFPCTHWMKIIPPSPPSPKDSKTDV